MLIHLAHCDGTCSQSPNMKEINYPLRNMPCYMARVWRSSYISKPTLPDPCKFGCKLSEDIENYYEPKMTDQKPAPVSVVELSLLKIDLKNFFKT